MKRVLLLSIAIFISIPVIIWALAGGQGKSEGNSCMSQCTEANAEFFNTSDDLTQFCQTECNIGTGQGSCLTSEDGCCVLFTADPDCIAYPECISDEDCNEGEGCLYPDGCSTPGFGTCFDPSGISCPFVVEEVCACSGITYTNDCERLLAIDQFDHDGACESDGR